MRITRDERTLLLKDVAGRRFKMRLLAALKDFTCDGVTTRSDISIALHVVIYRECQIFMVLVIQCLDFMTQTAPRK